MALATFHGTAFCDDAGHFAIDPESRALFHAWCADAAKGQELAFTVGSKSYLRSLQANNYYWGVVVAAAVKATGQDADAIHAFWCEQFLPNEQKRVEFYNQLTGERIAAEVDGRRSSKLTGSPFYEFVEECRFWLSSFLQVTTPDPDPTYWRKRAKKSEAA